MIDSLPLIGFQGWIQVLFSSPWTYVAIGSFFLFLLIFMSVWYLQSSTQARSSHSETTDSGDPGGTVSENQLYHLIEALGNRPKIVLLAAAGLECMPVTVPIRIAILSSEKKQRCLLIDLDTKRNAVWRAFGLERQENASGSLPAPSGIENLFILPAHYFEQNRCMDLRSITRNVGSPYSLILINAPCLDGHPDRKIITASSRYAFVFAKEAAQMERLRDLCQSQRCKILGCYKIRTNGLPGSANPEASLPPAHP